MAEPGMPTGPRSADLSAHISVLSSEARSNPVSPSLGGLFPTQYVFFFNEYLPLLHYWDVKIVVVPWAPVWEAEQLSHWSPLPVPCVLRAPGVPAVVMGT